jgi:hypothetical protein
MELIGSPETSDLNHLTPRNNPQDGRIQFIRDESIWSRKKILCCCRESNHGFLSIPSDSVITVYYTAQNICNSPSATGHCSAHPSAFNVKLGIPAV